MNNVVKNQTSFICPIECMRIRLRLERTSEPWIGKMLLIDLDLLEGGAKLDPEQILKKGESRNHQGTREIGCKVFARQIANSTIGGPIRLLLQANANRLLGSSSFSRQISF
jgi:hypothetical protein